MPYSDDLTIREARELYFTTSGFDERTYSEKWARFPLGKFAFYLPNFPARRKAVPLHDIDHILTEYKTDYFGEYKIAAYECGTGHGKYWVGWMINTQAIIAGALLIPRESVRAFARGRRSKGVYHFQAHEPLLDRKVGDLRRETTASEHEVYPTVGDALGFFSLVTVAAIVHLGPLVLLGVWLYVSFFK